MSRRNLLIASWVGGLITAGGILGVPISGSLWVTMFGVGNGLILLVYILTFTTGCLLGLGFILGLLQGRLGNGLFVASVLVLLVFTLSPSDYEEFASAWVRLAWAAASIQVIDRPGHFKAKPPEHSCLAEIFSRHCDGCRLFASVFSSG